MLASGAVALPADPGRDGVPPGLADEPSSPDPSEEARRIEDLRPDLDVTEAGNLYDLAARRPQDLIARIREVLVTYIENPDTVELSVELGSVADTVRGRFPRIVIALRDTVVKKLRVDRGYIVLEEPVLDLHKLVHDGKFRFREKGRTEFVFEVSEPALNSLLDEKGNKLKVKNARMRLEDGHLVFSGRMKVLLFNNHVRVRGWFQPRHGTEVHFNPRAMQIGLWPIPQFLLNAVRDRVNPVADLRDFRFDVQIGAIRTTATRLILASQGLTDYVEGEILVERRGERQAPPRWPSEELLRELARSREVRAEHTSGARQPVDPDDAAPAPEPGPPDAVPDAVPDAAPEAAGAAGDGDPR